MTRRPPLTRLLTIALGWLTVAWPLPWAPAWTYPLAILAALAALTTLPRAPLFPVTIAITAAAFGAANPEAPAILAPEGLFILAYLLLSDAPPALPHPARWLRQLIPLAVSALAVAATTLAALAIHPAPSPWLTLTGIAAAVAAYLIALPLIAPPSPRRRR